MSLSHFIDAMAAHLAATITPAPALVGGTSPTTANDLPAIVLAVADAISPHPGVGRTPSGPVEGALRVSTQVDLADPVLHDAGGDVALLSADRRTLHLPHGGVVRADATTGLPFAATDLRVAVGATTIALVPAPPGAGQASIDPDAGILSFGSPLAATGRLSLGYFVGQWDVEIERFAGEVEVDVVAADAQAVDALTRQVEVTLSPASWRGIAGLGDLQPIALGRIGPPDPSAGPGRRRTLTYHFDFERITPVIRTSGGPIRTVAVTVGGFGETFTIPQRGE